MSLSSRDERLVFSSVNMSEAHKIHQDTVGSRQFGCWTIHRWLLDHLPSGVIKHSWEIRQPNGHFSNIEHHFSLNENCFQFAMYHLFSLTSRYFHLPSEKKWDFPAIVILSSSALFICPKTAMANIRYLANLWVGLKIGYP